MHFGITEKPTMDCVSLRNKAGLSSLKFTKKRPAKTLKIAVVDNHTVTETRQSADQPEC